MIVLYMPVYRYYARLQKSGAWRYYKLLLLNAKRAAPEGATRYLLIGSPLFSPFQILSFVHPFLVGA